MQWKHCFNVVYMNLIEKKGRGRGSEVLLSRFGRRRRDESDFPSSNPRFVGSDVNTACSSVPVPQGAIWKRGGT